MPDQPANAPSNRFKPWLLVLLVLLCVEGFRLHRLSMPLVSDEGEYAYAGQLILQGIPPYELAYNMKLPGTYYAYAAGMAVFGQTIQGIHLMLIAANSVTIVFMFLLGRRLFGDVAGVAAAAAYGVMSLSQAVFGLAAHATHFVVLFAVPASWLLVRAIESRKTSVLFASACLYGMAFLMKQHGIVFGLFGGLVVVIDAARHRDLRRGLVNAAVFGAGALLPFGLLCLYLKSAGVFDKFWFWTFTYAHSYAAMVPWQYGAHELWLRAQESFQPLGVFLFLALIGLALGLRDENARGKTAFAAVLAACSFLGASIGFYFRGHYFILLLPALGLLAGAAVRLLQERLRARMTASGAKWIPVILFLSAAAWSVFSQSDLLFGPKDRATWIVCHGRPFVESIEVSRYIREHSAADARVAVMGSEPQIYFYAQRHSATGYIYTYALTEPQPDAERMEDEMIREIESTRPQYIVWVGYFNSWLNVVYDTWTPSKFKVVRWFDGYAAEHYERVGITDTRPDGHVNYLWDDEARDYHGAVGDCLIVYRRKPGIK
jgi:Dolichyl-phosphate-mannose-protein mannosyltransferase